MMRPGHSEQEFVIKNTFLQTRSPKARELYRKSKTVSVTFPLENEAQERVSVSAPSFSIPQESFVAQEARSTWCMIWIDESSFKDSSESKKLQLSALSANGLVKCYKNADKFLRAFDRKLSLTGIRYRGKDTARYIVLISEVNFDAFRRAVPDSDVVGTVVVLLDSRDISRVVLLDDVNVPVFFAYTWEEALEILSSLIETNQIIVGAP